MIAGPLLAVPAGGTPAPAAGVTVSLPAGAGDRGWPRLLLQWLLLALAYGIAARIGLAYSSLAPNVTLIWAPTGIALFAVLRWGPRLWPAIVAGDLIANAGTGAALWSVAGISLGNIAQAVVCAALLRAGGFDHRLVRVRDVVALLALGTAGAAISATIGPAALAVAGAFDWSVYGSVWLQWLMGDATGVVVITPLLLAWWTASPRPAGAAGPVQPAEALLLLAVLAAACVAIFGGLPRAGMAPGNYPAALALFPLAVWAALRFGLRGATLLTLLISAAAVWGTVHGRGPFVDGELTTSLLRWWVFANLITITTLLLSASQSERDQARVQAIHDRDFATAILDAEGALVLVLDADWRIERVNRALEAFTGFDAATLVGRRFEEALIPREQHPLFSGHAELLRLALSTTARIDAPLRRRRAPPVTVSWTTTVLRGGGRRIEHVIVSGIDVSARVEAAAGLRHARRELQQRVADRTRMLARANEDLQVQMAERQRLEGELIAISERTQQHFGEELHDGLGQHLTAAAIQAELLARDLADAGQPAAASQAQSLERMLSDAVAQTRRLARGLFPVELQADGLMGALRQLVEVTDQRLRRPCTLDCPRPVRLADHTVAIHLYRIAQEAVNNAVKHAPGMPVTLSLSESAGLIRLRITNPVAAGAADAQGAVGSTDAGMGLRILRHRANLIGASLAVERGPVWQVAVTLPATSPDRRGDAPADPSR